MRCGLSRAESLLKMHLLELNSFAACQVFKRTFLHVHSTVGAFEASSFACCSFSAVNASAAG